MAEEKRIIQDILAPGHLQTQRCKKFYYRTRKNLSLPNYFNGKIVDSLPSLPSYAKCDDNFWTDQDFRLREKIVKKILFRQKYLKKIIFACICLIIVFSFIISGKQLSYGANKIQKKAKEAQARLLYVNSEIGSSDFDDLITDVESAQQILKDISQTSFKLGQNYQLASSISLLDSKYVDSKPILSILENVTGVSSDLSAIYKMLNAQYDNQHLKSETKLTEIEPYIQNAQGKINKALLEIDKVDFSKFPEQQKSLMELRKKIVQSQQGLDQSTKLFTALKEIFNEKNQKYLLLFQNSRELRPTGGFLGTLGLLTINDGKIGKPQIQNTAYLNYLKNDVYGEMKEYLSGPKDLPKIYDLPESIKKLNSNHWDITEANFITDFSLYASKVAWLYNNFYHQEEVDGVISIDPKVFEDLLTITGPINIPEHKITVDKDTFWDIMEYKVEKDNPFRRGDKSANPKQVLVDFTPIFWNKIKKSSTEEKIKMIRIIFQSLKEKHIMLYSNNPELSEIFEKRNWSGNIKDNQDYLQVIHSTGSGKSAQAIKRTINHKTIIKSNGSIEDEVTLKYYLEKPKSFGPNFDFVEVFTPKDSKLLFGHLSSDDEGEVDLVNNEDTTKNVKTFTQLGKQVFAFKLRLVQGNTASVVIRYSLPYKLLPIPFISKKYSLLVQKQPGTIADELNVSFDVDPNFAIKKVIGDGVNLIDRAEFEYKTRLTVDRIFEAKFGLR